jgi:hypothetical protein
VRSFGRARRRCVRRGAGGLRGAGQLYELRAPAERVFTARALREIDHLVKAITAIELGIAAQQLAVARDGCCETGGLWRLREGWRRVAVGDGALDELRL